MWEDEAWLQDMEFWSGALGVNPDRLIGAAAPASPAIVGMGKAVLETVASAGSQLRRARAAVNGRARVAAPYAGLPELDAPNADKATPQHTRTGGAARKSRSKEFTYISAGAGHTAGCERKCPAPANAKPAARGEAVGARQNRPKTCARGEREFLW